MKSGRIPHVDRDIPRLVCGTDFLMGQAPGTSFKAFDRFWELGGRAFDTAHVYGANTNVFAAWTGSRGVRDEVIYFDKGCHPYGQSRMTHKDMRHDILTNHERLERTTTDLFVMHRDDPNVPVGEIIDWLNEFKQEGLIGAFGGSNWSHHRVIEANAYAEKHGKQGLSLNNPNLSLAAVNEPMWADCLTLDDEGRRWHAESGFPLFTWSSMARGYFFGADEHDSEVRRVYDNETSRARRERARSLAAELSVTPAQIALAWTLNQPGNVWTLAGLRTAENADSCVEAMDIVLSPEQLRWLEHGE